MMLNAVLLAGRLTRDPTIDVAGGTGLARCALAMNRKYKTAAGESREEVTFVEIEAWDRTARRLVDEFRKGDLAIVEGRLRQVRPDNRPSYLVVTVRRLQHGDTKRGAP